MTRPELTILLSGCAAALTLGLLGGGAMRPQLVTDGRPEGPQIIAETDARPTGPYDSGVELAAYHGRLPDYVMGTDWKKAIAGPSETAMAPPPREMVRDLPPPEDEPPPVLTRTTYEDPPRVRRYPSLGDEEPAPPPSADDGPDPDR